MLAAHPGWDPSRFRRSQRALLDGGWKYLSQGIWTRDLDAARDEVDNLTLW